jgi:PAS domain S-box-containing protein
MGYQNKTKDELIKELKKLKQEYDSLKTLAPKDVINPNKPGDLFETVISNAPISIFATDRNGIFILHEGKAVGNVGMKPGENVGVSAYDLFSELKVVENSGNVTNGKMVLDRVLNGECLSGITELNNVCFDNRFSPIIDSNGQVSGMIGVATDISESKKAEKALRESELKYRLLFENSGEAILLTNPDGSIFSANPEACRIFGRSEQELCRLGRNSTLDLNDPHVDAALDERRKTGRFKGILNQKRKDGTIFPAEVISNIFFDSAGNERTSLIVRDISEQKIAEEKLRKSEFEFRSLFDNSMIAISQAYPGGPLLRINKAYAEMYGYPDTDTLLNETLGNTESLFSNPADRERVLKALEKSDTLSPTEFELKRRNGEKFWALVGVKRVRDNTGKMVYFQAEHIDITNQKKLQTEQYLTSLYARNLIEAGLDPLVTISKDGKITDVNRSTEEITGINRKQIIGTDFADYFTEPGKAKKGYKIVFSKGVVKNYPLTIRHISGREIDVLYNATLYKNEAGIIQGVFAAARDITDRKKMEEELRNSKELLEKLNAHLNEVREDERSKIALNLHDDFGQRLTALNLDLAWLKSRMGVQSISVKKKLEEMSLMINESIDSIRELSSFLRPAILYELGLVPAFEWQLAKFKKQSGINFRFKYSPERKVIDDQISLILFRILQESLTNTIRHSGASVVEVDLLFKKKRIEMVIKDNGKGIDDEKINSITSMGITGITERVRSVNGNISINGIKDKGTVLKFLIPSTLIQLK